MNLDSPKPATLFAEILQMKGILLQTFSTNPGFYHIADKLTGIVVTKDGEHLHFVIQRTEKNNWSICWELVNL